MSECFLSQIGLSMMWQYIKNEEIPIVPLYYSQKRKVVEKNGILIPFEFLKTVDPDNVAGLSEADAFEVDCRYRSLGCIPCTGAIKSSTTEIDGIITEVRDANRSERENRIIDMTSDSSMEQKKKEGYF